MACAVTGSVLHLSAALALCACNSPTYSVGKDAAAAATGALSDAGADGTPIGRDPPNATNDPSGDATVPQPDTSRGATPAQNGDDRTDVADGGAPRDPMSTVQPDAGPAVTTVVSEPLPDAGVVTMDGPTVPSWAPKLLGKYAIVIYSFSDDGLVRTGQRDLGIMEFSAGPSGYEALLRGCQSYGTSAAGASGARVVSPEALPPRRFQVVLGADTFVAKPIDVAVGYEPTLPPSCDGHLGELVDKRDFQTWISGPKCRCSDQAPPLVDDCRVVDADGDKRPGYTVQFRTLNALADVYGAIESRSSFVQGRVADNGAHTAFFQRNDVVAQYGCEPSNCADVGGVAMSCDTIHSKVLFASLDRAAAPAGGWTCPSIIDGFSSLFPLPAPTFPARCKAP